MLFNFSKFKSPEYQQKRREQEERERIEFQLERKTVCFTGHRPNKMNNCYSLTDEQSKYISRKLEPVLVNLIEKEGIERFISGGAIGIDQIAFWTVQGLKKKCCPNILNIVAVPFKNQPIKWSDKETLLWYKKMLDTADEVIYVDELPLYGVEGVSIGEYHVAKIQKRNEYMVDKSRIVVAAWDGTKGGTSNCCRYVRKVGKTLYILRPQNDFELDILYGFNG